MQNIQSRSEQSTKNRQSKEIGIKPFFITICTKELACFFGTGDNSEVVLNELGHAAENLWSELPTSFPGLKLDTHIIMPNHMHAILFIQPPINRREAFLRNAEPEMPDNLAAEPELEIGGGRINPNGSGHEDHGEGNVREYQPVIQKGENERMLIAARLGVIIRAYKSRVKTFASTVNIEFDWEPGFYDHSIRTEASFIMLRKYVKNNASTWDEDSYRVS